MRNKKKNSIQSFIWHRKCLELIELVKRTMKSNNEWRLRYWLPNLRVTYNFIIKLFLNYYYMIWYNEYLYGICITKRSFSVSIYVYFSLPYAHFSLTIVFSTFNTTHMYDIMYCSFHSFLTFIFLGNHNMSNLLTSYGKGKTN